MSFHTTGEPISQVDSLPAWRRWIVQWDISHNAIPLAFFAFTAMWQTAAQHFGMVSVPYFIWTILYFTSCAILAFCIVACVVRAVLFPGGMVADFNHPRLMNFFFVPVIIGALCIITTPTAWRSLNEFRIGFYVLGSYQLGLALFMFGEWLFGAHPTAFIHPLVFMQTIGFFLLSIVGATGRLIDQAWAMFSVGCLLWLLVFITNLQHVAIALDKKRERPQPTFFLFIAPPAQAALAAVILHAAEVEPADADPTKLLTVSNVMEWPRLGEALMYIDLFLYLLMFRLFPTFWTSKFSVSWWAYIFPLSAAASTTIWRYKSEGGMFWGVLAVVLGAIATIAMIVVFSCTAWSLWKMNTPNNPTSAEAYARKYFGTDRAEEEDREETSEEDEAV